MTNFKIGIGNNLKLIRKSKGITQEDLASIIGIHSRQLSKIETGEHFPSCKTLEKLRIALDVAPKELFDFEFLMDEGEGVMTGTDNASHFIAEKSSKSNVYELRPNENNKDIAPKICTDESMARTAKAINQPIFVEYFDENKNIKLVAFYPDGTEKVIRSTIDVASKQNMNFMMKEFKKISKDKSASEFIKLALGALKNDDDLKKIDSLIDGMKLARGLD